MKNILLLGAVLWLAATNLMGQDKPFDTGQLAIFSGGVQVGTETFTMPDPVTLTTSDELTLGATAIKFNTQTTYRGVSPATFTLEQLPGRLLFTFDGERVKLSGARELVKQMPDKDAVLLENNVWLHYFFVAARYETGKGGVQEFRAFVPSLMLSLPYTLESKLSIGALRRYQLKGGGLMVEILTLPDGRLAYVGVPAQKAEAVRVELVPQLDALRTALAEKGKTFTPPDYSAPTDAPFTAEEVLIKVNNYALAGTLLLPKNARKAVPAVITITGSGQQTRDEPLPFDNLKDYKPLRQIAEHLAARGIAVLRVDDRGVGASTGRDTLLQSTTSSFADDTRAQIAYLRTRKEIDPRRIALLGHSEGGIIAPQIAATDPQLAAIVLLAGPALTGADISRAQLRESLAQQTGISEADKQKAIAEQEAIIQAVLAGGDLSAYPPEVRLPWVKEFWSYDPLPTMKNVKQPVLILQGALDQQVTAEQAAMLEKTARAGGNKDVTTQVFPMLNHLFLPSKTGSPSEYNTLTDAAVPAQVLQTIGDWLQKRLKVK